MCQPLKSYDWWGIAKLSEIRTVQLPRDVCETAEKKYKSLFDNFEQFLVFVLEELTNEAALKADEAELQIVEQRLKDLGYL